MRGFLSLGIGSKDFGRILEMVCGIGRWRQIRYVGFGLDVIGWENNGWGGQRDLLDQILEKKVEGMVGWKDWI